MGDIRKILVSLHPQKCTYLILGNENTLILHGTPRIRVTCLWGLRFHLFLQLPHGSLQVDLSGEHIEKTSQTHPELGGGVLINVVIAMFHIFK